MITVRGVDRWGCGAYYAKRGTRRHNGVDICAPPGEQIKAFNCGKVTKIGYPYPPNDFKKGHLRYVEVTDYSGLKARYFYVQPTVTLNQHILENTTIGICDNLEPAYSGITNHYHFEVLVIVEGKKVFVNPMDYIRALGYGVNGI